jgi:sugar/nucleoside kinase (ribokinase family)
MPSILVIGTVSQDTLRLPSGVVNTIGGAGLYTALAAATAGADATLFAPRPAPLPTAFAAAAERLSWIGPVIAPGALPRLDIEHHGNGKATLRGASWGAESELLPSALPNALDAFDWVHIAALSSAARQRLFFDACRARGARLVSVGTYARIAQAEGDVVRALFRDADAACMNDNEARILFGTVDAALEAAPAAQLRAVTLGAGGAHVIQHGTAIDVDSPRADEFDPTGAGDTFCGSLLAGIAAGVALPQAAAAACGGAARMIEHAGPGWLLENHA